MTIQTGGGLAYTGAGKEAPAAGGPSKAPAAGVERKHESKAHRESQARLLSGWKPPSLETAMEYRNERHPGVLSSSGSRSAHSVCSTRLGRHCCSSLAWIDPCCEGTTSELGRYGPAVALFFKLEKWLTWSFFALALVNTPSMMLYAGGGFFSRGLAGSASTTAAVRSSIATLSIGNLGARAPPLLQVAGFGPVSIQTASLLVTSLDVVGLLAFALALAWLGDKELEETGLAGSSYVTAANFSVMIPWVPDDATSEGLRDFLRATFSVKVVHVKLCYDYAPLHRVAERRKKILDDVERLDDSIGRVFHAAGAAVPESLILRAGAADDASIEPYTDRSSSVDAERAAAAKGFEALSEQQQAVVMELLRRRRQRLADDDEAQQELISARAFGGVQAAFVTCETRKDARKLLDGLPDSHLSVLRRKLFLPAAEQFLGRHALRARHPPRPSTVLWHHMTTSSAGQCARRAVTATVSVALLAISAAAVYGGRVLAPVEATALLQANATAVAQTTGQSPAAGPARTSQPAVPELSGLMVFVPPLVIAVTNLALNKAMRVLAVFEKHHTATGLELSITGRLIFRQFVNTALIPCLVYVSADLVGWAGLASVWPGGGYTSFEPAWYYTVGATVVMSSALDLFTPWSLTVLKLIAAKARLRCHACGCCPIRSQRRLNRLATGPHFDLSERYSRLVNTALTCLTFSAGMPALLWIATLCFVVALWMDKFLFVRCWRRPPHFNTRIAQAGTSSLIYGVILHSLFSLFAFGASALRTDGQYATDSWLEELAGGRRVDRNSVAYRAAASLVGDHMWAPFAVATAILLLGVVVAARAVLESVSGFLCPKAAAAEDLSRAHPGRRLGGQRVVAMDATTQRSAEALATGTYREVIEAGLLQDLESYDVRLHPDYDDAFAVVGTAAPATANV